MPASAGGSPQRDGDGFRSRKHELAAIQQLLRRTRTGRGGAIVIRGEPGIGKTALLERGLEAVPGLRRVQIDGQLETCFPFAGLRELTRPFLAGTGALPEPQRAALEVVFAQREGPPPNPSLLALAVGGLLSAAAAERAIVCVIDDAHALDAPSALVLAFVARRVGTEPVAFLLAGREQEGMESFAALPAHRLTGLGRDDALALLASRLRGPLDERIRDQIVAEARGNPRTLVELPQRLVRAELAGGYGLPDAQPPTAPADDRDLDRLAALPVETRLLLLLAAAEPLGEPALLWNAAKLFGIGAGAATRAEAAGLLQLDVRVRFRDPYLRLTVYRTASPDERRGAHHALAEVSNPVSDPDRRAWHRGQSIFVPDESVAAELERAAERARTRGGSAAAGAFLERAAALTPDPARRALRALAAAGFKYRAGAREAASGLLAIATSGPLDDRRRALAGHLSARLSLSNGPIGESVTPLLDAARELDAHDPTASAGAYLEALITAQAAGRLGAPSLMKAARAAASATAARNGKDPLDLLTEAVTTQVTRGHSAAVPALRAAVCAFLHLPKGREPEEYWTWLACDAATDLWDDDAWPVLAERQVLAARRTGALTSLLPGLHRLALARIHTGEFADAAALVAETYEVKGSGEIPVPPWADLVLMAWRGDREGLDRLGENGTRKAHDHGNGRVLSVIDYATAVLNNGTGKYEAALAAARRAGQYDEPGFHAFVPPELVEAAVRAGRPRLAEPIMEQLAERAKVCGTDWALGILHRSRALLDGGSWAEDLYLEAIHHLQRSRAVTQLARTHLLYGEWLRREARRGDALVQLRTAYEMLSSIGAAGFAARAARELTASGERPHKAAGTPFDRLTPQETQIALLVSEGATSKEAGSQLFLSPRTVDAHLRSIFKKLGLTSRRQLRDLRPHLPTDARPDPTRAGDDG